MKFYPEIVDRYIDIILDRYPKVEVKCQSEHPMSAPHLLWMLNEIETSDTMSTTKKHRWLGYVQGVMTALGWITVQEERDFTRNIFNGD